MGVTVTTSPPVQLRPLRPATRHRHNPLILGGSLMIASTIAAARVGGSPQLLASALIAVGGFGFGAIYLPARIRRRRERKVVVRQLPDRVAIRTEESYERTIQ